MKTFWYGLTMTTCLCTLAWLSVGCGNSCTLTDNQNGTATLKCGDQSYLIKNGPPGERGAPGDAGPPGDVGPAGEQGVPGKSCEVKENQDQTLTLQCGDKSYTLPKKELLDSTCQSRALGCNILEVTCGKEVFKIGNNSCKDFKVEELDAQGKVTKTLKSGDGARTGESISRDKNYRLVLEHKFAPEIPATQPTLHLFSNIICSSDQECTKEYCTSLRNISGEFDIKCKTDSDCTTAQKGDTCHTDGKCYKKSTISCAQDSDCLGGIDSKLSFYCGSDKLCYGKVVDEEKFKACEYSREALEPRCTFYPFHPHKDTDPPAFCVLFDLSGKLQPEPKPNEHRLSRDFPINNTCDWMKHYQSNIFTGDKARYEQVWKTVYKRPDGQYEFAGFVTFSDNTTQFFRYPWFQDSDITQCVCPAGQAYNATEKKCK